MILDTIIDIERKRYERLGYDVVVTDDEIFINDSDFTMHLGNDILIIKGFVFDEDVVFGDNVRISVSSATDALSASTKNLSSFNSYKVMKQYLNVKRWSDSDENEGVLPYSINAVRISPRKKC